MAPCSRGYKKSCPKVSRWQKAVFESLETKIFKKSICTPTPCQGFADGNPTKVHTSQSSLKITKSNIFKVCSITIQSLIFYLEHKELQRRYLKLKVDLKVGA